MKNICFYFQVHNPFRFKKYRFFDIGNDHYYYDDYQNEEYLHQVVNDSYLKANQTILEMIRTSNRKFRCAFMISGTTIEQLEQYAPEVIDSFKELADTGCIEFLGGPYAHSLAGIFDTNEYENQLRRHTSKIEELFGKKPTTLFNAELIYSDEIGQIASKNGFKTILIDEAKHIMGWKSPNFVYSHAYLPKVKLLVRNHKLSDDIAFRFSSLGLTSERFIGWLKEFPENENQLNIGMNYEVFGMTQPAYTGIFDFLKALPYHALEHEMRFVTPSEIGSKSESAGQLSVADPISWVGNDKNLTPWTGNDLQIEALQKLYAVSERVRLCNDKSLQHDWLFLQSTEHFRYMSHKDAHGSQFESPYEAFMNYMNILADFLERVDAQYPTTIENEELNELLKTINHLEFEKEELSNEIKKLKAKKTTKAKKAEV